MTEGLQLALRTGNKYDMAACFLQLGLLTLDAQNYTRSVRLLSGVKALRGVMGVRSIASDTDDLETALSAARDALGPASFEAEYEAGRAMTTAEAVANALEDERGDSALPPDPRLSDVWPNPGCSREIQPVRDLGARCPWCGGSEIIRHGKAANGKQKFRCRACGRTFRENPVDSAYDGDFRRRVVAEYRAHRSQRTVCRNFGISRQTLAAWLRQASSEASSEG